MEGKTRDTPRAAYSDERHGDVTCIPTHRCRRGSALQRKREGERELGIQTHKGGTEGWCYGEDSRYDWRRGAAWQRRKEERTEGSMVWKEASTCGMPPWRSPRSHPR